MSAIGTAKSILLAITNRQIHRADTFDPAFEFFSEV